MTSESNKLVKRGSRRKDSDSDKTHSKQLQRQLSICYLGKCSLRGKRYLFKLEWDNYQALINLFWKILFCSFFKNPVSLSAQPIEYLNQMRQNTHLSHLQQ